MTRTIRIRFHVVAFFLLLSAILANRAEATECLDIYGEERECTMSEEWDQCTDAADDAALQCVSDVYEAYGGVDAELSWYQRARRSLALEGCGTEHALNLGACVFKTPLGALLPG